MDIDDLLISVFAAATVLGTAETILRLNNRNASKKRYLRERWTPEKSWEQFDSLSGWNLVPGYTSDDVRINRHGFRGADFIRGEQQRILCLGDSVTFGPMGEKKPYPYIIRSELAKNSITKPVEVINAGIEGHSTCNMVFRLRRLLKLKPDVVIIFAGWTDMFDEDIYCYRDNRKPYTSFWHIESQKVIRSHVLSLIQESTGFVPRKSVPVSYSPDTFIPFNFEYNLKRIISLVRETSARAVLLTLPKLIPDNPSSLSESARKKIILPDYLEESDIKAFLTIYRAYDTIIRQVASTMNIPLFDAERWMNEQKRPRSIFFSDTYNLSPQGCKTLGKFIAKGLVEEGLVV